jgi:hypothetical protein
MKLFFRLTPFVLAALAAPAMAHAQVGDADRAAARALAFEANAALESKDYAAAAERFARADALVHAPTLLLGLARADVGLRKLVAAHEAYARILREGAPPNASPVLARAVDDARRELVALEPRMPYVLIEAKGTPNPQVELDGVSVPSAALGVKRMVDPGTRIVTATAEGFSRAEVKVEAVEGETRTASLVLVPSPHEGSATAKLPPSRSAPGAIPPKTIGFVTIGVGGAALIAGAVTGALALGRESELSRVCPAAQCPPSQQPAIDGYTTLRVISMSTLISGGVLAAAGTVLVLTAGSAPSHEASIRPAIGPGYLGATGSF